MNIAFLMLIALNSLESAAHLMAQASSYRQISDTCSVTALGPGCSEHQGSSWLPPPSVPTQSAALNIKTTRRQEYTLRKVLLGLTTKGNNTQTQHTMHVKSLFM